MNNFGIDLSDGFGDLKNDHHFEPVFRIIRKWGSFVSKILILSTYFEDSLRMWGQWNVQAEHLTYIWNLPYIIGNLFVLVNILTQLVPAVLVIANKQVLYSLGALVFNHIFQTIIYRAYSDFYYVFRFLALIGGLILVYISSMDLEEARETIFAALPSIETNKEKQKNYMLFGARCLLVLMFLAVILNEEEIFRISSLIFFITNVVLLVLIAIGFQTSKISLIASLWLLLINFYYNSFWNYQSYTHMHDYHRFEFFQTLSCVGSLLILVNLGPGKVSIDNRKKRW